MPQRSTPRVSIGVRRSPDQLLATVSELLRSRDCMAADLVRAVVADGSASRREPPRVVLILTWGGWRWLALEG